MMENSSLEKKLKRAIAARKQAEKILEDKALQLFALNQDLEKQVEDRTSELRKAKLIAEQAQNAQKTFLANMSHEIRTPLNAIIGMSHLMRDSELSDDQLDYLDILSSSANILQALISDLLDLSKIEAGKIEIRNLPVNLPELIAGVEKTFKVRLDSKPVEIFTEVDPKIKNLILSDELILNQIFLNLVGNAEKFTERGKIIIRAIVLNEKKDQYKIKIEIEDTGIGISESKQTEIFDEFKQATANIYSDYGGTGLGLAITKKLIDKMGGEIHVESQEQVGTKFFFILDFLKTDALVENSKNVFSDQIGFENITNPILILEDNIMNQKYLSKLLEKWKLPYEIAENGQVGLDLSLKNKYSLMLMDIQMPIMDGYECTKNVRKPSNPNHDIPIIALTASTLLTKKQGAISNGMDDFVPKPFNPKQLADVLSRFIKLDAMPVGKESQTLCLDKEQLKLLYDDDLDYAKDIFQTFLEITPVELSALKKRVEKQDMAEVQRLSHKIKPTFGMVGIKEISDQLLELENAAKLGEKEKVKSLFGEIDAIIPGVLEAVRVELSDIQSKLELQ